MPVPGSTLIAPTFKATSTARPGVWSPGQPPPSTTPKPETTQDKSKESGKIAPVWQPFGQQTSKQYRSIKLDKLTTTTKEHTTQEGSTTKVTTPITPTTGPPPLERLGSVKSVETPTRVNPPEVPAKSAPPKSPASQLSPPFTRVNETHLPRSQSPTVTLLQKAREGQIPKGAVYMDENVCQMPGVNDTLFRVKSAEVGHDYRKVQLEPIQHEGIGPTTPHGVPISLRTNCDGKITEVEGIKEENKGEWYKKMYKSLHRLGDSSEDDYIVVKYRRRGRIPYSSSGYMSEPEPERDDFTRYKYATLDRRRPRIDEDDHHSRTLPPPTAKSKPVFSSWTPPSAKYSSDVYRNQPRRIEDYEPGYSSIAEREAKLDDGSVDEIDRVSAEVRQTLSMLGSRDAPAASYSFKDGYESDSTLVYKKKELGELPSPLQQRSWYREIQKGGDIPLTGFRRPAPDKIKALGGEVLVYHTRVKYTNPPVSTRKENAQRVYVDPPLRYHSPHHHGYQERIGHVYSPLPPHRTTSKYNPTLIRLTRSTGSRLPPRRPPLPVSLLLSSHYLPKPYGYVSPPLSPVGRKVSEKVDLTGSGSKKGKSDKMSTASGGFKRLPEEKRTERGDQQSLPSSETGYHSLSDAEKPQYRSRYHQQHRVAVSQVMKSIEGIQRAFESEPIFRDFENKVKNGGKNYGNLASFGKTVAWKPLEGPRYQNTQAYNARVPSRRARSPRSRSVSPPNIDYRAYILSILRTLKKSERFLQLHNCYTSLDQIAKLEKFLLELERINRKRGRSRMPVRSSSLSELDRLYTELDEAQKKKAFFYKVRGKDQWRKEKDRGLRCRDWSVEDLRRMYMEFRPKESAREFERNGLYRSSRSVSELVDRYSSLDDLKEPFVRSFSRRSYRSLSPLYRSQEEYKRVSSRGSQWESRGQSRASVKNGRDDLFSSPNVPVCLWTNKVQVTKENFEGIIHQSQQQLDIRSQSLPRNMDFRFRTDTPSTVDYSESDCLSPVSIPSSFGGLNNMKPWSYLDASFPPQTVGVMTSYQSNSWGALPNGDGRGGKVKHVSMFPQKKYPPPVNNYFTSNYVPERTMSTIDLSQASDEMTPFGRGMNGKCGSLSQSSLSDLGSQEIVIPSFGERKMFERESGSGREEGKVGSYYLSRVKSGDVKRLQGKFENLDKMEETGGSKSRWRTAPTSSWQVKRKTLSESSVPEGNDTSVTYPSCLRSKIGDGTVQKLKEKFNGQEEGHVKSLPSLPSASDGAKTTLAGREKPAIQVQNWSERESNGTVTSSYVYHQNVKGDVRSLKEKYENVALVKDIRVSPVEDNLYYISVTSRSTPDITIDLGEIDAPIDVRDERHERHVSRAYVHTSNVEGKDDKASGQRRDEDLDRLWYKYAGYYWQRGQSSKDVTSNLGYDRASLGSRSPSPRRERIEHQRTYTYSPLISTTPTPGNYLQSDEEDENTIKTLTPGSTRAASPSRRSKRSSRSPSSGRPTPTQERTDLPPLKLTRSVSSEAATGVVDLNALPPVPAPPPKVPLVDVGSESPHRYQETEVNIHYKTPVRSLEKEYIEEEELRRRQEEMMKQFYEEEKRKKFIQEMSDMDNRRHSDNFIPSQKSPIPLDRYDNPFEPPSTSPVPRARTPEPKTVARAKFNFSAQNARELSFNKGDVIFICRRIDKNWFEGEHHGMIGLFPVSYVEIISYENVRSTAKKTSEGIAKAKYNFHAQSSLELPLVKGEMVVLTRRVDNNWYMGRVGAREGIVPISYLDVVREPGEISSSPTSPSPKPVASPVSRALVMNGSALSPSMRYDEPNYLRKKNPVPVNYPPTKRYLPNRPPEPYSEKKQPVNQSLHIDTHSEAVPYRALYEYHPQNEDELQLNEGDTVFVMEKCDDGWYVGSSLRTGFFGTFPGNYVERLW